MAETVNEEALDDAAIDFLTFGSEIALQLVPEGSDEIGYVGTTTTGTDSCYVNYLRGDASTAPAPHQPRHVRFTVCPPTRFAEKRALLEAEENWAADKSLYTQAQMDDLRFEAERDHEDFDRLKGSAIMFGQRISLHQFASGKSLCFSNRPSVGKGVEDDSDDGVDALSQMKVIATDDPASGMVLRVMPGFNIRSEGDPVRYGDVIQLKHSKHERTLLVFPIQKTGHEISFSSPYIEDVQRVVTSDTKFSRLRVMPIATHAFGNMAEPNTHENLMMGGAFVNLLHRESSRLLRVTNEEALSLDDHQSKTSAAEDAAHSWCVQDVSMEWSGRTVDGTRIFALRHSQTDLFLCCDSNGKVTMSNDYADKSCHWCFDLIDSDGSIMYDVDSFYVKSVPHQSVLRYDNAADGNGGLSTVQGGKHAEYDCFIARYVSHSSISKLVQISTVLENIATFKKNLVIFNEKYGDDMAKQREKIFKMKNTEWAAHTGEQEMFFQMRKLISVQAPFLLDQLLVTMRGLFPNIDAKSSLAEITDFMDTVIDIELVQVASGMQLVPAIIDLYKNHLFHTPCVLFGGPLCFYGEDIFLAVRLSFRLMGIISRYSEGSAKTVYADIDWITNQVGLGRFKAAEAISAVLLTWPDMAETVPVDHKEFLPLMWGHVLHDGENKKGNGDHCESLSTVCVKSVSDSDKCVGDTIDNMFGDAVTANQDVLSDMIEADGGFKQMDKLVTTYLGYITVGMKDKHAEALEMHFRQPLAPTDFEYYVGRLLELVSNLCIGNPNMVAKAATVFSHERMLKMAVNDGIHPFIRAKSVKLGTVLYMKSAGVIDTAPRIRVSSEISPCLSEGGRKFKLSPEHCEWREFFFDFMHNLDRVMTPEKRWHNRLARQVFRTVLILFKGGDFNVGRTELAANMDTARKENGLPTAEMVAILVNQFQVDDDAGWGREPGPDPRKLNEESRVLMHLKLTLIEMILHVFTLWQSTRVDEVVEIYVVAAELEDADSPGQSGSSRVVHENPMSASMDDDEHVMPSSPKRNMKNSKNSESSFEESVKKLITTLHKAPLLSETQVECLIVGCKLVSECEMLDLRFKAFELLFDVTMPDKDLATMVTDCKILRSEEQATTYAELAKQVDELKLVAAALADSSDGNSPGTEKDCARSVAGILKTLQKESVKALFSDLQCQVPVVNILIAATSSDLCCECLQILEVMASGHPTSQEQIVELALETGVLPAVQDVAQQKDALECIKTLFKGNRPLCEAHVRRICAVIYQTVLAGCTPEFMVNAMETLPFLISDGNDTYPDCQVVVCRTVCHLLKDVKFPGTQAKLFEFQIVEKLFSSAEAVNGAALTTKAYIASMRLLGLTAGGKLGVVETMCARLLPLDEVIPVMVQLNEIGSEKNISEESAEIILSAKREVANFLRHVYGDTASKRLIGMMQMRENGVYFNGGRKSVVEIIVADMMDLTGELGLLKNMVKKDNALREYVFDSSVPLLYHLLYITDLSGMNDSERKKATASVTAACTILPKLATLLDPVDAEIAERLCKRAQKWLGGSRARVGDAKKIDTLPLRNSASSFSAQLHVRVDEKTAKQDRSWFRYVDEMMVQMKHVRRKQDLVAGGIWGKYVPSGMVILAVALWSAVPEHYTTDEHPCVKNLLGLLAHPHLFSTTRLLEALDSIRMVLYFTRGLANKKLEEGTPEFVKHCYTGFIDLDLADMPVHSQEIMCDYGLLQCCLQIVESDESAGMEAAALRIMAASLSGESPSVQKVFLKELNEHTDELFVSCYRNVITIASDSIEIVYLSSQRGNFKSAIANSGIFEAAEFMRVIKAVCAGDAQAVQDYIREQPARLDRNDGISVLVDYLSVLERFFPAAITYPRPSHFDEATGLMVNLRGVPRKFDPRERDMAEFYHDIIIEHTVLCLDTIADISDGPNLPNQKRIVDGPLLEGINKLLDCMDLRKTGLFVQVMKSDGPGSAKIPTGKYKPVQPFDYRAVRMSEHIRVLDKIIFVLKALLEGPPNKPVHERILHCIKWKAFARRLVDLYNVLKSSDGTNVRSMRRFETRAVRMFEVVEQLADSSVLDNKSVLRRILSPILGSEEMVAFFRERLGYVEIVKRSVVNDSTIESLEKIFFPLSTLYVNSHKQIEKSMGRVILNKCPLGEDEMKLRAFLELSLERVIETTVSELAYFWGETFASKVQCVLAKVSGKKGQVLEVCTIAINAAVILSYHRGGSCPMCRDTFRSDEAHTVFLIAAPVHVFMSMVAVGSWFVVRAPVLMHRIARARKMKYRDKLTENESSDDEDDAYDPQQSHALSEIQEAGTNLSKFKLMDAVVSLASASMETVTLLLSATAGKSVSQYLSLKFEPEFVGQIFIIATSAAGLFVSPLFFSVHMFFVVYNSDLEIVLGSFTSNWKRLGTVGAFMVLVMLVYATMAFLVFENSETEIGIGDEEGRCTTLLQCFISYSYRGIGMTDGGLAEYLPEPQFATSLRDETVGDVTTRGILSWETARLVWEASFNLITISMLGAIITGIICDSFGALRDEKDTAELYRKTTNFITGIPFAVIAEVNQPAPNNYFFFLLYLRQKEVRNNVDKQSLHISDREPWELDRLTASEEELTRQIDSGDVSWMPRDTCIYMQHVKTNDQIVLDRVGSIESSLEEVKEKIAEDLGGIKEMLKVLLPKDEGESGSS